MLDLLGLRENANSVRTERNARSVRMERKYQICQYGEKMLDMLGWREKARSVRTERKCQISQDGKEILDLRIIQNGFHKKISTHSVQPFGQLKLTYIQTNIYERRTLLHRYIYKYDIHLVFNLYIIHIIKRNVDFYR